MLSDVGWCVSFGKCGGGSWIDLKWCCVMIDGVLYDLGSIIYMFVYEVKYVVEVIDGILDLFDYSGCSCFMCKVFEVEVCV